MPKETQGGPQAPIAGLDELLEQGQYAQAVELIEAALSAGRPADAETLYRKGHCLLQLGRYGEAQEALLEARSRDANGENRFRISVALANLMLRTGRYAEAARLIEDLLESPGRTADEETLLRYSLGQARFYLGELRAAAGEFKKALAHYRKTDSPRGTVSTLQSLAATHQLLHEPAPAIESYLEAYRIASSQGDDQSVALIYLNLGALYLERANYSNALRYFTDALGIVRKLGRVPYEVSLLCNLGNLEVRIGRAEEAEKYFAQAETIVSGKPELKSYRGYLHAYRAELFRERGDFVRAREDLEKAQEIFSELKSSKDLLLVAEERFELSCRLGEIEAARKILSTAQGLSDEGDEFSRHKLALLETKLALLEKIGEAPKRLLKSLDRAIHFFRESGYQAFLWETLFLLGKLQLAAEDSQGGREQLLRANDAHEEIRRTLPEGASARYEERPAVREFLSACQDAALDKSAVVLLKVIDFNKKLNEGLGQRGAEDFLRDVLDEAIALAQADEGYLLLGNEVQAARSADHQDLESRKTPAREAVGRMLLAEVQRTGKSALVFASQAAPDVAAFLSELELVSLLVVPIRARGEVLGSLYLQHRFNRGAFTQENLFLIEAFCDLAGLALLNSRRLEQALDHEARLSEEVEYLKRELSGSKQLVVGGSRAFQKALRTARQAAKADASVLIRGETGTGKELLAQEIHALSPRKNGPYVRVNVPAIPATLLESELFGHEAGAFTGAKAKKLGLFEIASGGTILLDEIGDLPAASQVKLLRVLQERRLTRLGGAREVPVDVRVLAATNRQIESLLQQGLFREDLYYRLAVITLDVPPLRDRPEDVLPLAENFLSHYSRQVGKRFTGISARAKEFLLSYSWPGNVRELENLIQRAVLLEDGPQLELSEGLSLSPGPADKAAAGKGYRGRLKETQAEAIRDALSATGGNKKQAARMLGLSRSRFYELMEELGVG
ncbi:MAG: sigma 54-interacting transcriptional regulator [Bdellovibrionota bacterium]